MSDAGNAMTRPETDGTVSAQMAEGVVVALAPGLFEVASGEAHYLCTLRGKLRKQRPLPPAPLGRHPGQQGPRNGNAASHAAASTATATATSAAPEPPAPVRIAPGDRVRFTRLGPDDGVIEEVLPRHAALSRMRSEVGTEQIMLANPDQAILVFAVSQPEPHLGLLDRYLALCEHAAVPAVLCFNKVDLGIPDAVSAEIAAYEALGYPVVRTSATSGEGIAALRERLGNRVSLLTGPSGVGKSSLLNMLIPDAQQRIGEISSATGKGRHTTTGVRLLPLPEGGWLADSAGIRELALWRVPPDALPRAFVELRPFADDCLYEDCQHTEGEEGCALWAVLERGDITPRRWASFQRLLEEARAEEKPIWQRDE